MRQISIKFWIVSGLILLIFGGSQVCLGQSAAFKYSGIPDYYRDPTPENYDKMMRYKRAMSEDQARRANSSDWLLTEGENLIRSSENDFGGALKTILRNADNAPGGGSVLKGIGTGAEFLDFLNRAVKVSDEYNKGKGGNSYNAAVLAGRELTKMLAGNYFGGLAVTAVVGSGGSLLPAFVAGYVACKGSEEFLQLIYKTYDNWGKPRPTMPSSERKKRMADNTQRAKEAFDIPDSAEVTTFRDERGNTMQETEWTDLDTGQNFTYATWYNSEGFEVSSDFDRSEFMEARRESMGAGYRRTGRSNVGRTVAGDIGEIDEPDDEKEEDSDTVAKVDREEGDTPDPVDINILDYVEPRQVTAQATTKTELSMGAEIGYITTVLVLKFTNVGSMVPPYGKATMTAKTIFPNGESETSNWIGTFSGGPNGVFCLMCEEESLVLRLQNGTRTEPKDGVSFVVQGGNKFKGWPKQLLIASE